VKRNLYFRAFRKKESATLKIYVRKPYHMKRFLLVISIITSLFCIINNVLAQTQTVVNGAPTTAVNFPGIGCTYKWVNNTTGIGLPASGTGNIASFNAVNIGNSPVIASITATPVTSGFAYITNQVDNTVSVIDISTNTVVKTIPVGSVPNGVAVSQDNSKVYISNFGSDNVSVIDASSNTVTATIAIGSRPSGIAISPNGSTVYALNVGNNLNNGTVSVIRTSDNLVVTTITVQEQPTAVVVSPDNKWVYVTNFRSNTISIIDASTNSVLTSIPAGGTSPSNPVLSPDGSKLYVTNINSRNVSVFNTASNTLITTIMVGQEPLGICVSPDGSRIYVSNVINNNISVIDASSNTVILTYSAVNSAPSGISLSPDGSLLYVENTQSDDVTVIDVTSSVDRAVTNIAVGTEPESYGIFTTHGGTGCVPVMFTITVNPSPPTITAGIATGNISACAGMVSASPDIRQFTVSGNNLTTGITATAPGNFEISLSPASGYSNSIIIPESGGSANSTIVYVRSAAAASPGDISGNIMLVSGTATQSVMVTGIVNALPTVNQPPSVTYANGTSTTAIGFTGTANTYKWTNDTQSIGLAGSGTGNIASFTAVNTTSSPVVAHVQVTPFTAPIAYVANDNTNGTVSVINTATNEVLSTISVGSNPIAVSVSPDGSFVYVANVFSGSISVINTINNTVTATIDVGEFSFPNGIVVSPDGSKIYVANNSLGTVSVVSTATNTLLTTPVYTVGTDPYGIAISPDGNHVYVSNEGTNNVSEINITTGVVTPIAVGTFPTGITVSPDGSHVYVANQNSKSVSIINTATDTRISPDITAGNAPVGVALSPDGTLLYVTNANDNNVMVFNTANNSLVATIPVGTTPYGISITPDGTHVYVTNQGGGTVSDINTQTNAVTPVTVGSSPYSFGNFIKAGIICSGPPADFTITVTPAVITVGTVTGNITACVGTASAEPNIQQFTVEGSSLSADIVATAPQNFEVSLTASGGYGSSITLPQLSGTVNSTVIYVRSAASAPAGNITGNVTLTSGGVTENAAVTGVINAPPMVDAVSNQIVTNGAPTAAINFTGTATTYNWTNDNPNIGLASSGTGDITSFTAINTGNSPIVANITVTPEPAPGVDCSGSTVIFTITVKPSPVIAASAVTGSITACAGTASVSPDIQQFTIYGGGLTNDITATAPQSFEISLSATNNYGSSLTLLQSGGIVNNTVVYVRSSATATAGNIAGDVILTSGTATTNAAVSGVINALPAVDAIPNQIVTNGTPATAINFTGTANSYSWVNDTPDIGLAASGTGDIASFTTINTGNSPIVANITVTPEPAPGVNCSGSTTTFTITVTPTGATPASITASTASGSITACAGTASASPNIEQFTVSGNGLSTDITASAPTGFEISLTPGSDYSGSVTIAQSGGSVTNTVLYVRSAASDQAGNIAGNVTLISGATSQSVAVTGIVNALPTVNVVSNQIVSNGQATGAVNFTGTVNSYSWVNDTPGIGLATSGTGDIAPFTAINTGNNPMVATITVTPEPAPGVDCTGSATKFTITVNPTITPLLPTITTSNVSGSISACSGSASAIPNIQQFTISGSNLTTDINATAPQNFEISLSADNGYSNNLTIPQSSGTVNNAVIYVRSSAVAAAGPISGKVTLTSTGATDQTVDVTGIVNEPATVNAVSNQIVADGAATTAINFTGTANTFNWFNDVPGIGLAANGSGNIPSFIAVNTTISPVTATVTVVPVNAGGVDTGCDGAPVTFTITVNPSPLAASVVVPNAFTPNNDGVNDTWNIKNIYLYPNNTVDIFNRYGQKVYSAINYGTPWDGTYKGETLPTGTYYYVIDLKNGTRALSGYVALIR